MNKLVLCFCLSMLISHVAIAETNLRIQMLDAQIEKLESERATKLADLQKCEKETKGFKIAGLSTLALTGVGIYANVKLNEKIANISGSNAYMGGNDSNMRDNRSQIDKDCSSVKELFELGLASQEEVNDTCK